MRDSPYFRCCYLFWGHLYFLFLFMLVAEDEKEPPQILKAKRNVQTDGRTEIITDRGRLCTAKKECLYQNCIVPFVPYIFT